ncbi:MAG: hypothetical protein H7Z37_14540 [Pyrinomonadaceae bacterium]|nr:hypothetical protein [Pyrinomonadaceae bacterium]
MNLHNCPRCGSNRIRRGYMRPTILMHLVCRTYLLCDKCNWEFADFAIPGTVSTRSKKRRKNEAKNSASFASSGSSEQVGETEDVQAYEQLDAADETESSFTNEDSIQSSKIKKRVRVKMKK